MTATQLGAGSVGAVVVFWLVGAYNRLVRLRSALVARFGFVDEQLRARQSLLDEQLAVLATALTAAGPRLEALGAACRQADAAREHARVRPARAAALTSLRVAEDILADARARLPVQSAAGVDLPGLNLRLAESDAALAFARREFNDCVVAYNEAVQQFPTLLVAQLFAFRVAAPF